MRTLLLAALVLALVGCDRAVVGAESDGTFETSVDLGVVRLDPELSVRILPGGLSGPLTLTVDGQELPFDSTASAFVFETTLERGLTTFTVVATDDAGATESDTLAAVYLPIQSVPVVGADGGVARYDAAEAAFDDGRSVVAGGLGSDGRALSTATIYRPAGAQIPSQDVGIGGPRTGHTATIVDGGALLLGGARRRDPQSNDFVTDAEWIGPDGATLSIEVDAAVQRTRHTTHAIRLDGTTYLYLYGGLVGAGSGASLSGTVDVFEVVRDESPFRLARLSPPGGSGGFEPLADHVQVRTERASVSVFGVRAGNPLATRFVWTTPGTPTFPFQLGAAEIRSPNTPRTDAAAVEAELGLSLVFGGLDADGDPLASIEVYAPTIDRWFRVPDSVRLMVPRSGHSATILGNGRIVVIGGRSSNGTPLVALESFLY